MFWVTGPAAFMYYRSAYPMMAFPQLQQSAMYQHAMFQNQRLRNYRRSASSGVAAFAAGDNVATGTQVLKADCRPADPVYPSVQSFADAYPAEALAPENEIPEADESGLLEPESTATSELDFPSEDEGVPQDDTFGGFAPPAPVAPVVPQPSVSDKRKKKVTVQLDSASAEEDQDDQADETSFGTRRGGSGNRPAPANAGPMFPVTFGSTNGGAIAIANSYSTGKGGSATSHATAYGSPASVPEERRRSVIAQQQQLLQARNSRPAKLRTKY
ncbi:AGAP005613-PA-like protein [Anopheles sinensis]|uniref:AGAP005613-PA-like protein n=1 Tax=Anopheles sinensis TaxID=74873 RepID=A0A084VC96_ANOSI|nr:AGAP005613-PA-like protein [Anopheles sinensis]